MIIRLNNDVGNSSIEKLCEKYEGIHLQTNDVNEIITSSKLKSIDKEDEALVSDIVICDTDMQLSSKEYMSDVREITFRNGQKIGGSSTNCMLITGPCSVESREQVNEIGDLVKNLDLKFFRGGCYKPRTSPYSFQGLGLEGLKILSELREKYDFNIVTEVRDHSHVSEVIEYADVIQIGAKAMYDHGILKACAKTQKPILLKRGFGTTLQEFVQAAEFMLSGGNPNIMLCERGIRTFESKTRFTLDLCGVAFLKEKTNLPIVLDPSHAMGYSYGVPDLARACFAMGIHGLLIESHPNPKVAKSDASQQLNPAEFLDLHKSLSHLSTALGKNII